MQKLQLYITSLYQSKNILSSGKYSNKFDTGSHLTLERHYFQFKKSV